MVRNFNSKKIMAVSTSQKLRIKEGSVLRTLHAPASFKQGLGSLPPSVKIGPNAKDHDQLHWFVTNRAQMEDELDEVLQLMKEGVTCWIYYPKGSSAMQTDLTRDKGWDALLKHKEMQWVSLISFDETWSAFGMRLKTKADEKKDSKPKERAIFEYIDAAKKIVHLPEDLAAAFKRAKKEESFFNHLSFTNRKEYVEWIVSAKRQETRAARVKESIERLGKEWKNPANR
jgi:hypothetical protein